MEKQIGIPCANCQSWKKKEKKFSCNPDDCKQLTAWLLDHAPQLTAEKIQMQLQLPETSIQYVV